MLLGEFDLVDTILEDDNTYWLTKLIFYLFLIIMSVSLMNLVIALAIHDIGALRYILEGQILYCEITQERSSPDQASVTCGSCAEV